MGDGVIFDLPDDKLISSKDAWSYLVKFRDGFACRDCGGLGGPPRGLEAHHIDRDKKNNRLYNGVTLCNSCHMARHHYENSERTRRRNAEGLASLGGQAAKRRWAERTPEERAELVARIGNYTGNAGRKCSPGCSCGRHGAQGDSHCRHGHPYDETNTYVSPDGDRSCRACKRVANARRYDRRRREGVVRA